MKIAYETIARAYYFPNENYSPETDQRDVVSVEIKFYSAMNNAFCFSSKKIEIGGKVSEENIQAAIKETISYLKSLNLRVSEF